MNKRPLNLILGTILVLVLVAGYFAYQFFMGMKYDIRKISGSVTEVGQDSITIQGIYEFEGNLPEKLSGEREITFKVNSATVFNVTKIYMPSREELISSGQAKVESDGRYFAEYSLNDRPKIQVPGSLEDIRNSLKGGVSIKAEFSKSIYNSRNPVASDVSYIIMINPVIK